MHKKRLMAGAALTLLVAVPAILHAQTPAPAAPAPAAAAVVAAPMKEKHKPKSRTEAIQMLEVRLAELKKMTDAEWTAKHAERTARRGERMEKFRAMTPEQRATLHDKLKAKP